MKSRYLFGTFISSKYRFILSRISTFAIARSLLRCSDRFIFYLRMMNAKTPCPNKLPIDTGDIKQKTRTGTLVMSADWSNQMDE